MSKSHGWIGKDEVDWLRTNYFTKLGLYEGEWELFLDRLRHYQWPEDFENDPQLKWTIKQAVYAVIKMRWRWS